MRAPELLSRWALRWATALAVCVSWVAPGTADPVKELFASSATGAGAIVDHSDWDKLLKKYVRPSPDGINRVDYAAFKAQGSGALGAYIAKLEATDVSQLDRPAQFAFLANLYNAKTISLVIGRYPVESIRDIRLGGGLTSLFIGGPWQAKVLRLGGVELSLDDIEHEILRALFKDPRVHYAVNCASMGCPNIGVEALTGPRLNAQLDAAARAYINHPRGFSVQDGRLVVSSIYNWFKADFGGTDSGVIAHAREYAGPALKEQLKDISSIGQHAYDWRLNDVRTR